MRPRSPTERSCRNRTPNASLALLCSKVGRIQSQRLTENEEWPAHLFFLAKVGIPRLLMEDASSLRIVIAFEYALMAGRTFFR